MTTLETERLRLRPFRMEDAPDIADYAIRPEFARYLPLHSQSLESVMAFVTGRVQGGQPDSAGNWHFVIQETEKPRAIGTIRIGIRELEHRQADLGYALNPNAWDKGYSSEALQRILAFGFHELGIERIWVMANIQNAASWRVMERAGMEREGFMRHHRLYRAEWWDTVLYGIVRDRAGYEAQSTF